MRRRHRFTCRVSWLRRRPVTSLAFYYSLLAALSCSPQEPARIPEKGRALAPATFLPAWLNFELSVSSTGRDHLFWHWWALNRIFRCHSIMRVDLSQGEMLWPSPMIKRRGMVFTTSSADLRSLRGCNFVAWFEMQRTFPTLDLGMRIQSWRLSALPPT